MANGSLKQNKTKGKKLGNISLSEENHTPDFQLSKKKNTASPNIEMEKLNII